MRLWLISHGGFLWSSWPDRWCTGQRKPSQCKRLSWSGSSWSISISPTWTRPVVQGTFWVFARIVASACQWSRPSCWEALSHPHLDKHSHRRNHIVWATQHPAPFSSDQTFRDINFLFFFLDTELIKKTCSYFPTVSRTTKACAELRRILWSQGKPKIVLFKSRPF